MTKNTPDQVIPLAAIFQFATQVGQLATTGDLPGEHLKVAVNSLFARDPATTLEVYGKLSALTNGLQALVDTFYRRSSGRDAGIRYVMGILHLQKHLARHPDMLSIIASRLETTHQQAQHFTPAHNNIIASLASIYTDTISTFSFRIQVAGDYQYLQQARVASQIRVLLFAGIRSAVLWRQLGGSRIKTIVQHKRVARVAEQLLVEAKGESFG